MRTHAPRGDESGDGSEHTEDKAGNDRFARYDLNRNEPAAPQAGDEPVLGTAVADGVEIHSTAGGAIGTAAFLVRVLRGEGLLYFHDGDGFFVKEPRNGVSVEAGQTLRVEVAYRARGIGVRRRMLTIAPTFGPALRIPLIGHGSGYQRRRPDVLLPPKREKNTSDREPEPKPGSEPDADVVAAKEAAMSPGDRKRLAWLMSQARGIQNGIFTRQQNALEELEEDLEKTDPRKVGNMAALLGFCAELCLVGAIGAIAARAATAFESGLLAAAKKNKVVSTDSVEDALASLELTARDRAAAKAISSGFKDVMKSVLKKGFHGAGGAAPARDAVSAQAFIRGQTRALENVQKEQGRTLMRRFDHQVVQLADHPLPVAEAFVEALDKAFAQAYTIQRRHVIDQWCSYQSRVALGSLEGSQEDLGEDLGEVARGVRSDVRGVLEIGVIVAPAIRGQRVGMTISSARIAGLTEPTRKLLAGRAIGSLRVPIILRGQLGGAFGQEQFTCGKNSRGAYWARSEGAANRKSWLSGRAGADRPSASDDLAGARLLFSDLADRSLDEVDG